MNYKTIVLISIALLAGLSLGFGFGLKWAQKGLNPEAAGPNQLGQESVQPEESDADEADLYEVEGFVGNGLATRSILENRFNLIITTDLSDPEAGKYYQAWLAAGEEAVPIGRLEKQAGEYGITFDSQTDFSGYHDVIVSLEQADDGQIEVRVLEGSF